MSTRNQTSSSGSRKRPVGRAGRATIRDVAEAAAVSPMTVSNVLNGRLQFVSETTRKRVEREIERLNYRRQASARNLRVAESRSIGMVIVDESPQFLADTFTCQVIAGLANVLNGADYTLTVQGMPARRLVDSMIMRTFDVGGFCAMLSGPPAERGEVIQRLARLEQPVIVFQENPIAALPDVCTIRQDDRGGAGVLADHLLARRARDIAMIVPETRWPAIENRIEGVRDSIAAAGGAAGLTIIESRSESHADVQKALARHLDGNAAPDALIGGNDAIAIAAMLYLLDNGLRVPDDIRVVGFNAFEMHRHARPRLTTIVSAAYSLGERAGHAMLERLDAGEFERSDILLPVSFDPGATT